MKRKNEKCFPCGRTLSGAFNPKVDLNKSIEKLNTFIAEKKLNQSEARVKILEVMIEEGPRFNARDLVSKIGKRHPQIGKATIYRNLPLFIESGLLQEGPPDSQGQTLYELSSGGHLGYVICLDCDQLVSFQDSLIERRLRAIGGKLGFSVENRRTTLYSRCKLLARSGKSRLNSAGWLVAGSVLAASMAIAVSAAALDFGSSSSLPRVKSAESAMIQSCGKEFAGVLKGKSVDQVDRWAEAQENAEPLISTEFKKTQCYTIHEIWERIAQRNEWASSNS